MEDKIYWLAFSQCNGIGPVKFGLLLDHFGTAKAAWDATEVDLVASGIGPAAAGKISDFRKKHTPEAFVERLEKHGANFLILPEASYPTVLKQITRPPFVLYHKGNRELLDPKNDDSRFAVVGTRKITEYGTQVTESLTTDLVNAGFIIVSGLALGVDAVAHAATLEAKGKTIAVLGSGVDYCTPRENQSLYNTILEKGGTIVSEVPLGYMPLKGSFPSRNRIIAGLSVGVLVTEGAEDSGSLITAANAVSLNKKVFAVPGPITSSVSKGANLLINKGARMVTSARDILEEVRGKVTTSTSGTTSITGDNKEEQLIIDLLVDQHLHFDDLAKKTGIETAQLGTLLSLMEMKGFIYSVSIGVFGLKK